MNIKKMFTALSAMVVAVTMTMPSATVFGATYSEELQGAYDWAYEKGVTTMSSIDNANMYGAITRSEMAKMLSVYAVEVLGYTPDTSAACTFTDIDSVKGDLHDYIIKSCQLGLMGQGITAFRPYDTISRAEFGTALSRTLWGNQYEGGTPYYAKHLEALKAAGIMNQIANAEATKEVRGYVMLMLQRSEENGAGVNCDDEDVVLVCLQEAADGKYEECPAACRVDEDNNEDEVVKSGSLVVTASANSSKKVVKTGTSDMDTLAFKTSEEVTITKIVLERYGRSYPDSITNVWLEDEDGNVLTTSQDNTINSKDKVTLSLKKDYRLVDGTLNAIVRVSATNASGSTIGFKVADVTSTAKDVDLGNYTPFEYDIIDYDVSDLTVSANATTKSYNYVAGDSYEVAKFKLRAGTAAVKVRGFTLYNLTGLSDEEFVDSLAVAFDGKEVKNLSYGFDSDDYLVVSFDEQEIAINKSATVTVTATFNEDFDEYGQSIQYAIREGSDVKAIESKTSASVVVTGGIGGTGWATYTFEGSKVKLTSTTLGNVDAAQGAEGILIADGTITLSEAINKGTVTVHPTFAPAAVANHVDHLTLIVNGDEYDSHVNTAGDYEFTNVEIEESGKVQVKIDINDNENASGSITFGSLQFVGFKYVQNKNVTVNPTGTIKVSKVTLQPAKATMSNDLTKSVQFIKEESARKVVFEGTYTAKKGDIYLNKFMINTATADAMNSNETASGYNYVRTFYVYVDGEEVGDTDEVLTGQSTTTITENTSSENFSNVLVKKGESVKIKVEAEIDATNVTNYNYDLFIWGTDENDNTPSGIAYDSMVTIEVVAKGTVTIPTASSSKNTVLLKAKNQTLATFTVKPSNNNEGINLENLVLSIDNAGPVDPEDYRVRVAGVDYSDDYTPVYTDAGTTTGGYYYLINEELPTAGLTVEITLKEALTGTVTGYVLEANSDTAENGYTGYTVTGGSAMKTFTAKYASALVYIASQSDEKSYTTYKLGVDKYDDDYEISDVVFSTGTTVTSNACASGLSLIGTPTEDGDTFDINNLPISDAIRCVSYVVKGGDLPAAGEPVAITTNDSSDYFKVNGTAWRVYKAD